MSTIATNINPITDIFIEYDEGAIPYVYSCTIDRTIDRSLLAIKVVITETNGFETINKLINNDEKIHKVKIVTKFFDINMAVKLIEYKLPIGADGILHQETVFNILSEIIVHRKDCLTGKKI